MGEYAPGKQKKAAPGVASEVRRLTSLMIVSNR